MSDINEVLAATRTAVHELAVAAEGSPAEWMLSRAAGKWSPSQVVEHVARALEESANVVAGVPSRFPTFPALLRPVARSLFFNRVLKTGAFPKARTTKAMDPASGPATPAAGGVRLEAALSRFDQECRAQAARGARVQSGIFGAVTVADYARFQEIHTRHHRKQMPPYGS
jgi:hypothetical protein